MARAQHAVSIGPNVNRLLPTLERLLAIDETDLHRALDQACHMVAEALGADKVDAALYDAASDSLVAAGTSHTPMGRNQHAIGMNRLPVANGGREVEVFVTGETLRDRSCGSGPGATAGYDGRARNSLGHHGATGGRRRPPRCLHRLVRPSRLFRRTRTFHFSKPSRAGSGWLPTGRS